VTICIQEDAATTVVVVSNVSSICNATETLKLQPSSPNNKKQKVKTIQSTEESTTTPLKKEKKQPANIITPSPSLPSSKNKKQILRLYSNDLAKVSPQNDWVDLHISPQELRPSFTLTTGQCFHWIAVEQDESAEDTTSKTAKTSAWGTHDAQEWVGIIPTDTTTITGSSIVISIRETPSTTLYRILYSLSPINERKVAEIIQDYFQLHITLEPLYQEWSLRDERLKRIAEVLPGVRIIRQDPIECLFSFICSSNNNIPRITKILSSFREMYGDFLLNLPARIISDNKDETHQDAAIRTTTLPLYSFPTLAKLQQHATEEQLRSIGLGYRAKYMVETIKLLSKKGKEEGDGGTKYLHSLRSPQNNATFVQEELIQFSGIGRKVADCVALFSLDVTDAIPVDVHVREIALRDYVDVDDDESMLILGSSSLNDAGIVVEMKSLTPTIYKRVGDLFRTKFGKYAGWAHSLLFVAELPSFRPVLPVDIVNEMIEVSVFKFAFVTVHWNNVYSFF